MIATLAGVACGGRAATSPSALDLSGTWTGTGTYPNAPFRLSLVQSGDALRGSYMDRHDSSNAVTGTVDAGVLSATIDFGDGKLNLDGVVEDARRVSGTMRTSALGNRPYPFTMTR